MYNEMVVSVFIYFDRFYGGTPNPVRNSMLLGLRKHLSLLFYLTNRHMQCVRKCI